MTPTVCILTAGKGTRMGPFAKYLNKAVMPLGKKAVISHIIEKFPPDTEFVIGLGFLASQVRNYLEIAHSDRHFTFVTIPHFEGPGSGPGFSLLTCRNVLQKPFYFVSCDTLWADELTNDGSENWIGVARVSPDVSERYCNMRLEDDRIAEIKDKVRVEGDDFRAFVGLCYIKDYSLFFEALESKDEVAGEVQISNGLGALVSTRKVLAREIAWTDIGDIEKYQLLLRQFEQFDFSKPNEVLYIVGGKVIKLFESTSTTEKRVARARLSPGVFPKIIEHRDQFFSYEYWPGKTLYEVNSPRIFSQLLSWLSKNLWTGVTVEKSLMAEVCQRFYRDKTFERIALYHGKYGLEDAPSVVNGTKVPATSELLARVSWETLFMGIPRFIHGDLQFDNILFQEQSGSFLLLDWRQDFGGHLDFGDLYYDLAKLYGGIVLNYDLIKKNLLTYNEEGDEMSFDFAQRFQTPTYLRILEEFVTGNGWDYSKVRLIGSLIYLNMAPLHSSPFDRLLYSLGRKMLSERLSESR